MQVIQWERQHNSMNGLRSMAADLIRLHFLNLIVLKLTWPLPATDLFGAHVLPAPWPSCAARGKWSHAPAAGCAPLPAPAAPSAAAHAAQRLPRPCPSAARASPAGPTQAPPPNPLPHFVANQPAVVHPDPDARVSALRPVERETTEGVRD